MTFKGTPRTEGDLSKSMAELTRTLVCRLREYFGNRRGDKRCPSHLPFRVTPADRRVTTNGSGHIAWMEGVTVDLSGTGLGLHVPAIRIGEHYLVGENRKLRIVLELPTGSAEIEARPVRYESLGEDETRQGYIIGVRILALSEPDRVRYEDFVHGLANRAPVDRSIR